MAVIQTGSGLQHIGVPTENYTNSIRFYQTLGFELEYATENPANKSKVGFLRWKNLTIEVWEEPFVPNSTGAINHFAVDVADIEATYLRAQQQNITIKEGSIQFLPFWKNGIHYFTIIGPNDELIEFSQKL